MWVLRGHLINMLREGAPPANATARIAYLSDGVQEPRQRFLLPGWPDVLHPGFVCETVFGSAAIVDSFVDMTKNDDRFTLIWPPQVSAALWPPATLLAMFRNPKTYQ